MLSTQTADLRRPSVLRRLVMAMLIMPIGLLVAGMAACGTLFLRLFNVPSTPLRVAMFWLNPRVAAF